MHPLPTSSFSLSLSHLSWSVCLSVCRFLLLLLSPSLSLPLSLPLSLSLSVSVSLFLSVCLSVCLSLSLCLSLSFLVVLLVVQETRRKVTDLEQKLTQKSDKILSLASKFRQVFVRYEISFSFPWLVIVKCFKTVLCTFQQWVAKARSTVLNVLSLGQPILHPCSSETCFNSYSSPAENDIDM